MLKPIVFPYKMGSQSARTLAQALRTKRVRHAGRYRYKKNHLIVNWGSSRVPAWRFPEGRMLNHAALVGRAANKLTALVALRARGVPTPEYTTNRTLASMMIVNGDTIVARAMLTSHSGKGISIHTTVDDLPDVPLYVEYIKKTAEYRVHVFGGQVLDVQLKRKRAGYEGANYQVRNHRNGWVYCRDGVEAPAAVTDSAVAAVAALGLDFGAVDVVWNRHRGAFVLEVNTAPGVEGLTLTKYVEAISNIE